MVSEVVVYSILPSSVQMALAALQSVVSVRVILIALLPGGSTVMIQLWQLLCVALCLEM